MKPRGRIRRSPPVSPACDPRAGFERMPARLGERWPVIVFAVKFLAFLSAFYALSFLPAFRSFLPHYLHAVACLGNGLVHFCGEASTVTGATLSSPQYGVTVSPECSAVEFAWFIGAVVLSFPAPWRARILGLLGGVVFIALLNSLRVASLFLIGIHARVAFDLVHEDVWAVLLIIGTTVFIAGWIAWIDAQTGSESKENRVSA
jgi:exosortase/archaeosortase family protein